jgi:glutathione synthase/RimK-type ligase-like ATP-grasp enzyme
MTGPLIAIATCAHYPASETDDERLREALRERGAEARPVVWDEEGIIWGGFDICLVRSTWDYHEKHARFLDWTRGVEAVTALRNPAATIAWNSDKTYLRELAEQGVRTVPTVWVTRGADEDLEAILAEREWDEAVVKPVVDLGARNLRRAQRGEDSAALKAVLSRHDAMVQPFLPSLETQGELSLVFIAGNFSHAARKRPAKGDFRVQSLWGGTVEAAEADAPQMELAQEALGQLDEPPLYARVDLVTGLDGNPCLIELELIEPNLYLDTRPGAAAQLAHAVLSELC